MGKLDVKGTPSIAGNSDITLKNTLAEPNSPEAVAYSGKEKLVKSWDAIEKYKGEYGSFRYLYREEGMIIGGLKVSTRGTEAVLSTVFVDKEYRNKGIASKLLEKAKKDFKNLQVDSNLTQDGAKFFGVKEESHMKRSSMILESLNEARMSRDITPSKGARDFTGQDVEKFFTNYLVKSLQAKEVHVDSFTDDSVEIEVIISATIPKEKLPKNFPTLLSNKLERSFKIGSERGGVKSWGAGAKSKSISDTEYRVTIELTGSYKGSL